MPVTPQKCAGRWAACRGVLEASAEVNSNGMCTSVRSRDTCVLRLKGETCFIGKVEGGVRKAPVTGPRQSASWPVSWALFPHLLSRNPTQCLCLVSFGLRDLNAWKFGRMLSNGR